MKFFVGSFIFATILLFLVYGAAASETASENKSISLTPAIDSVAYTNNEYTSLFKMEIKNKEPCSPKDSATVLYNISKADSLIKEDYFTKDIGCSATASTGNFIPAEAGNYTLCGKVINSSPSINFSSQVFCKEFTAVSTSDLSCDLSLQLKKNETLFYQNGQSIQFKPELSNKSFPFVIEYWIEDLFGEIVKPKINTTNAYEKSWKTNVGEQDRVLLIKAAVYPSCNDQNFSNNVAQEMFIVINNGDNGESNIEETALLSAEEDLADNSPINSTINVTEISPETISFGETLNAELEIYKGATDKYSVSLWLKKGGKIISEKTKIHLKNKNTFYKLILPVQIEPNCDGKIKDGSAQLVVEGLGLQAEKEVFLKGINEQICISEEIPEEQSAVKSSIFLQVTDFPPEIDPGESFNVKLQISDKKGAKFEAWSYLYRGSKCYSCASGERDENKISFMVDDEIKITKLPVTADQGIDEGEYNLMVKYKLDDAKTEKSITQKVYVPKSAEKVNTANQTMNLLSQSNNFKPSLIAEKINKKAPPGYEGIVVYESTSEKSKNLVSWFLITAFGLLILILLGRRGRY